MWSSPGALNESREWIMEISSWRVKGVSRTEGGEEGVGEEGGSQGARYQARSSQGREEYGIAPQEQSVNIAVE